jgi:hypothetical protein
VGLMKIAASLAYKDILNLAEFSRKKPSSPEFCAYRKSIYMQGFMARRNNIGDRGSPCRTPCLWRILLPDTPFTQNVEDAVAHSAEIQSLQCLLNPRKAMTSSRYLQLTVSKALEMSILNKRAGTFFV